MDEKQQMLRNQQAWDAQTGAHVESEFYDVASFKAGKNSLRPFEQEALGDVRGRSLLHLMCHFGLDTLSWARLGAQVTGVDFSAESIAAATALAQELSIDAQFLQANVYELPGELDGAFDFVVMTYGTLIWLPDLDGWARAAARCLKPGGTLFVADFHPTAMLFDDELALTRSYFRSGPTEREVKQTYAGEMDQPHIQTTWPWTVAKLVTALGRAGLHVTRVDELPLDLRQRHPLMTQDDAGFWRLPGDPVPLLLICQAVRPARSTP
ncbi:methyltransferase domain-containing protein [Kribbella sp. NPDC051718]|uniref:class I SAM-dependent methyltransferase n=1 Tax=Kribbella sp. NPDC051718 TaxID=3155168 RepID=UPI003441C53C